MLQGERKKSTSLPTSHPHQASPASLHTTHSALLSVRPLYPTSPATGPLHSHALLTGMLCSLSAELTPNHTVSISTRKPLPISLNRSNHPDQIRKKGTFLAPGTFLFCTCHCNCFICGSELKSVFPCHTQSCKVCESKALVCLARQRILVSSPRAWHVLVLIMQLSGWVYRRMHGWVERLK